MLSYYIVGAISELNKMMSYAIKTEQDPTCDVYSSTPQETNFGTEYNRFERITIKEEADSRVSFLEAPKKDLIDEGNLNQHCKSPGFEESEGTHLISSIFAVAVFSV